MPRVIVVVLVFLGLPAAAHAQFADPAAPGPPISVTDAQLDEAIGCSEGITGAQRAPVLLLQGTGATAEDNWSWTYEPALTKRGIPWCHVDLPDNATRDIQINGEYVVGAIRRISAQAGRKVSIIGHSQGGMIGRWALRFWPDTRAMVDDVIGFAPSNRGTIQAAQTCGRAPCPPSDWQQWDISNFMKALNSSAETWEGISYTNVITRLDEIVVPATNGYLSTGRGQITNVATQDICPTALSEHLLIGLVDPVAHAMALDALGHDGPGDPARISRTVCLAQIHEGIDPLTGPLAALRAASNYFAYEAATVAAEPALRCYATGTCPVAVAAPRTCESQRRFTVTLPRLRGLRATVGGRAVRVRGRRVVVDLRGRRAGSVALRATGRRADGRRITVSRRYRTCIPARR